MITRSQSAKMSVINITENIDNGEEIEVNNQLGLEGIYEEETQAPGPSNQITGERGQESPCQNEENTLDKILALLVATNNKLEETNKEIKATNAKVDTTNAKVDATILEVKETRQEVKDNQKQNQEAYKNLEERIQQWEEKFGSRMEKMERVHSEMKEEIKVNRTEMQLIKENVVEELQKQETNMNQKLKVTGEGLSKQIGECSEENKRTAEEIKKRMNQQKQETKKALANIEESVNDVRKTTESQLTQVTQKESAKLKEINQQMERLQQRLNENEGRTIIRCGGESSQKDIKYDGNDPYPMEFIRELTEYKRTRYGDLEINWIANHLEKDAGIWWKIIRDKIQSFDDFIEMFTEKYWSSEVQGIIRDDMEFGRFKPYQGLTSTQYVERKVLEYQQITPRIPEKLLVKKLVKHFGREVQIAVVTRGIENVNKLVTILHEFEHLYRKQTSETQKYMNERPKYDNKPRFTMPERNFERTADRQAKWNTEKPVINSSYNRQKGDMKPVSVIATTQKAGTSQSSQREPKETGIKKKI